MSGASPVAPEYEAQEGPRPLSEQTPVARLGGTESQLCPSADKVGILSRLVPVSCVGAWSFLSEPWGRS